MTWFTPDYVPERGGWTIVLRTLTEQLHICRAVSQEVAVRQCYLLNELRGYP